MERVMKKLALLFVFVMSVTLVLICGYTVQLHGFTIVAFNRSLTTVISNDSAKRFTQYVTLTRRTEDSTVMSTESSLFTQSVPLRDCVLDIKQLNEHMSPEERQKHVDANATFLRQLRHLLPGGRFVYRPVHCKAKAGNVAVIVPYRNRENQLPLFLRHMHSFLQTQQIGYAIFIIEMVEGIPFNRGLLMNVGFEVAARQGNFTCFVFHDVDLLPTNERNLYDCSKNVRHMSTGNSKNKYKVPYNTYFGGVVSFNENQYRAVNGFSNLYFGWGQEDDDLLIRIKHKKLAFDRIDVKLGRYEAMNHSDPEHDEQPMVNRKELIRTSRTRMSSEGLNSLIYKELRFESRDLYTWVLVDVNKTHIHNRYLLCNKKNWPCDFKHVGDEAT